MTIDPTNARRADWAATAVDAHARATRSSGESWDTKVGDLLCNLRHLWAKTGASDEAWGAMASRALSNYREELDEEVWDSDHADDADEEPDDEDLGAKTPAAYPGRIKAAPPVAQDYLGTMARVGKSNLPAVPFRPDVPAEAWWIVVVTDKPTTGDPLRWAASEMDGEPDGGGAWRLLTPDEADSIAARIRSEPGHVDVAVLEVFRHSATPRSEP
jgi:hypothetical protein